MLNKYVTTQLFLLSSVDRENLSNKENVKEGKCEVVVEDKTHSETSEYFVYGKFRSCEHFLHLAVKCVREFVFSYHVT